MGLYYRSYQSITKSDLIHGATYFGAGFGKVYWTTSAAVEGTLVSAGVDARKAANLAGTRTSDDAQYALVLVVDDQAVEIYEILHN